MIRRTRIVAGQAIKILESSTAPKKIITEDSYQAYVEKALEPSEPS